MALGQVYGLKKLWDQPTIKRGFTALWGTTLENAYAPGRGGLHVPIPGVGEYRPAIIDSAISFLPGTAGYIINQGEVPFPNAKNVLAKGTNILDEGALRAMENARARAGIEAPESTGELLTEMAPALAPIGSKKALAKGVPKVAKNLWGSAAGYLAPAAKTVAKGYGAIPGIVRKPANFATKMAYELSLPFAQHSPKETLLPALGIGTAADAFMDYRADAYGGVYNSITDKLGLTGEDYAPTRSAEQQNLDSAMSQAAQELGAPNDIEAAMQMSMTDEDEHVAGRYKDVMRYVQGAAGVGGAFAYPFVRRYAKGVNIARRAATVDPANRAKFGADDIGKPARGKPHGEHPRAPTEAETAAAATGEGGGGYWVGKQKIYSDRGPGEAAVTGSMESSTPITSNIERHFGRDLADEFGYEADVLNNQPIQQQIDASFVTGELPGTTIKTENVYALMRATGSLTPEKRDLLENALVAGSSLDDLNREGVQTSLGLDLYDTPTNKADLEAIVARARADPDVSALIPRWRNVTDAKERFKVARGRSTQEKYNKLREERPNYVPLRRNLDTDIGGPPKQQTFSANIDSQAEAARSREQFGGVSGRTGVGRPTAAIISDLATEIRAAAHNDFRVKVLRLFETAGSRSRVGRQDVLVKELPANKTDLDEALDHEVWINGERRVFRVNDPALSRALRFEPRETLQGLSS